MPVALQVISTGGMYGAERVLLELASYLQAQGWDSRVLAIDGAGAVPLVSAARQRGLRAEVLSAQPLSWLQQARALASYVEQQSVDVVHSHGYKPDVLLAAMGQTKRRACIATCHSWYSVNLKLRVFEQLDKLSLRRFAAVIAVSEEIELDILRAGVSRARLQYIPNGLDPVVPAADARAQVRAELGLAATQQLLLRVGRLARSKGNDVLLRAIATLPSELQPTIAFLGDGEEQQALRQLAETLGVLPRVAFLGFRDNVQDYLAASDVFVIPSLQEGLPMVLLEAMAAACPVVATEVGAMGTVMVDREEGLLVPPGDVEALAGALKRMLSEPALAAACGAAARAAFQARFSRDAMGGRYASIYRDVAGNRR
jgi:glycosyltransferase involved in cell wall biosynthesis